MNDEWFTQRSVVDARTQRLTFEQEGKPVSWSRWIELLGASAAFRGQFNRTLADTSFAAVFWELPPITRDTTQRDFECVVIEAPTLARMGPEPEAFSSHFREDRLAVSFGNLGGDAQLVAPTPRGPFEHYTHLAEFARRAPLEQVDAFWTLVAATLERHLSHRPIWLSTSGLGVGWLHVRLDQRPKYYNHAPYTSPDGG